MSKRVIVSLDLDYLSGVDLPAQEPATVRAFKNHAGAATMAKTVEECETEITELKKRLASAEKRCTLTDAHKAFARTLLDAADREAFVEKSVAERDKVLKEAMDADPEVYVSKRTGKAYRKSEQNIADMAKELDEQHVEKAAIAETARKERVAKRVASLDHLSDDEGGLTYIVDAVDKCQDDKVKKAASAALDGLNAAAKQGDGPKGVQRTKNGAGKTGEAEAAKEAFDAYVGEVAQKKGISMPEAHMWCVEKDAKGKKLNKAWKDASRRKD